MICLGGRSGCWPTSPAPASSPAPLACQVEGNNGKIIAGRLQVMDLVRGWVHLAVPGTRASLTLRFDQFRRLRLLDPLLPSPTLLPGPGGGAVVSDFKPASIPFTIDFTNGTRWQGHTLGVRDDEVGLFLFEPVDEPGTVRRTFVPRSACSRSLLRTSPNCSLSRCTSGLLGRSLSAAAMAVPAAL